MKHLALTVAFAGMMIPAASASIVIFSGNSPLDGPNGNVRTFMVDGLTIEASADSTSDGGATWDDGYLGIYSHGLGVTNHHESTSRHVVDNSGYVDRVTFAFSSAVVLDRVYLRAFGDTDISVGYYSSGSWNFLENSYGGNSSRWANINSGNIIAEKWTVSALLPANGKSDKFKIKAIKFKEPKKRNVPDGGSSVALLGMGLVALASARKFRK